MEVDLLKIISESLINRCDDYLNSDRSKTQKYDYNLIEELNNFLCVVKNEFGELIDCNITYK